MVSNYGLPILLHAKKLCNSIDNLNNHIWNARLQRTFKNNEFTAYFTVSDILNQNIGIDRNFYGNTYSEVTNDRLKRYFMIGFTWDFKNKAVAKQKIILKNKIWKSKYFFIICMFIFSALYMRSNS